MNLDYPEVESNIKSNELRDIMKMLNQLATDVALIKQKLDNYPPTVPCKQHDHELADHETRLRKVEDFRSRFYGAMVLMNIVSGIIIGIVVYYLTRL